MGLQTISSGAFSFQKTEDNRKRIAIAGTMNISVDKNNEISGDFRVHDSETPGGLPTPPAGTLTYMFTEKIIFSQEITASANNQSVFTANTELLNNGFTPEDNIRVYLDDEEIRENLSAFTVNHSANTITITSTNFTDEIVKDESVIRLEWMDTSFNQGISEKDGWHFCDGRTLKKEDYSALYNAIGDLWNNMIKPEETLLPGFIPNVYHPFNQTKQYEGDDFIDTFDIDFDPNVSDSVVVYRRTSSDRQADTWANAELLVENVHYQRNSSGDSISFISPHKLASRWEIMIHSKKITDEFQIPDLRGYFLRGIGADTNEDSNGNQKFGIASKQGDSVKKHSHFMVLDSAGGHRHDYVPWFWYAGYDPEYNIYGGSDPILGSGGPAIVPSWADWSDNSNADMIHSSLGVYRGKMSGSGNVQEAWNDLKAVRRGVYSAWSGMSHHYPWSEPDQNPTFTAEYSNFYNIGTSTTAPDYHMSFAERSTSMIDLPMANNVEPSYFILGAGPSSPIGNSEKYHHHEIWLGDPDASGNATSSSGFNNHDEVDVTHVKLPIFIKY